MHGSRMFFAVFTIPCAFAACWLLHAAGFDVPIWQMAANWMLFVGLLLGLDWYTESQVQTPTAKQTELLLQWFDAQRAQDHDEEERLAELVAAERPKYRWTRKVGRNMT